MGVEMPFKYNPFSDDMDYYVAAVAAGGTVVSEETYALADNAGGAATFSRSDHTHGSPPYPVAIGGYYFNSTGVNPNGELGYGTWTQVAQGQFLIGET